MTVAFPRHDGERPRPGTWRLPSPGGRGIWQAFVTCPACGFDCSLRSAHDIAADGTVMPSLVCPQKDCGFHEMVRLEGWPAP